MLSSAEKNARHIFFSLPLVFGSEGERFNNASVAVVVFHGYGSMQNAGRFEATTSFVRVGCERFCVRA